MRKQVLLACVVLALVFLPALPAYELFNPPARWVNTPHNIRVDQNGMTDVADSDNGVTAARNAINEWNSPALPDGSLLTTSLTSTGLSVSFDGVSNLMFFDPTGQCSGSCLAAAFYWTSTLPQGSEIECNALTITRRITDSDIVFNTNYSWYSQAEPDGCSGEFSLEAVTRHEAGHLFGLSHSGLSSAVMYASVSSCNNKLIAADDIAGRDALYNCGSCQATCSNNVTECSEACDGTDLSGESCVSQGFDGGVLACGAGCNGFDTSGCFGCGDGICNGNEDACSCPGDCGQSCGDGILNCGETCDGTNLNGASCSDFGFVDGPPSVLDCAADCSAFDTSMCCTAAEGGALCFDGLDNDCDGFADGNDPDDCGSNVCTPDGLGCSSDTECCSLKCRGKPGAQVCKAGTDGGGCTPTESPETSCTDGLDNDCDGTIDSADTDCGGSGGGESEKGPRCSDGVDNDGDGLYDCADPDCSKAKVCK